MIAHLPILQVIVPLMAAPVCLLLNRGRLAFQLALLAGLAAFLISILLLDQVLLAEGAISYSLGGWAPPWGIEYRVDTLNAWLLLIISGIGLVVLAYSYTSITREIDADLQVYFYVAYLLCLGALLGIAASGDIFNIFVFLEISALSSYILIALGRNRLALWASFQYLIMGTLGATFLLIGIGLLYAMTGTLNLADLAERLAGIEESRTVLTAYVFLTVGVFLKLAVFPLHLWLPNAYTWAPSVVSAFLAATATKTALYLFIRFTYSVFGFEYSFTALPMQTILVTLGLIGVFAASLTAIVQENVKRMFAYSSVAQIGYLILGIGIANATGLAGTLLHIFNHALMKGALFLALGAVMYRLGDVCFKDLAGLGRQMPLTMAALVIGGLSLIGVPMTAGFISKWYFVSAALEQGWWTLAMAILLGSLLAAVYVWRLVEAGYFRESEHGKLEVSEAPLTLLAPMWILVIANIYFGLDTRLPISVSEFTAASLMEKLAGPAP